MSTTINNKKCDDSLNLTCDELYNNGCITAEEKASCDDAWHTDANDVPAPSDENATEFVTVFKNSFAPVNALKANSIFSERTPTVDEVCYDDDVYALESECISSENTPAPLEYPDPILNECFDYETFKSMVPKSISDLDTLLWSIGYYSLNTKE